MGASVWDGSSEIISSVNADNTYLTQSYTVAVQGQTLFTLTNFAYAINTNSLDIEVNGVGQRAGIDFTETSTTSFTMVEGLAIGDVVYAIGLVGAENAVAAAASAVLADADRIAAEAAAAAAINAYNAILLLTPASLPLQIANGGTGQITKLLGFNALSPQTTKGDLIARDATNCVRLAAGATNGMQLTVDSTTATGLKYQLQGTPITSRASNTIITLADSGKYFALSGTFTQTFDTPANLTADFTIEIENVSTGEITIPASDGRTNWKMYAGEKRTFRVDSTATTLSSSWSKPFTSNFIAGGSFIKPPGYLTFDIEMWNAGCSGGKGIGGGSPVAGIGGGGGGYYFCTLPASLFANSETVTVGSGGAAVASASTAGNIGGVSSIGSIVTQLASASYFQGSSILNGQLWAVTIPAVGFECGYSYVTPSGKLLYGGSSASSNGTATSGSTTWGGAAGGSVDTATNLWAPGTSTYGGNGGAAGLAVSGTAGTAPGGGGGGTQTGTNSGAGARGEVRIRGRA